MGPDAGNVDFVDASRLNAPSNLTAFSEDSTAALLEWRDNSTNETGFEVELRTGTGAYLSLGVVSANGTAVNISPLQVNLRYTFRVRALAGSQTSDYSNEALVDTLAKPKALAVVTNGGRAELSWEDGSIAETGYAVQSRQGGDDFEDAHQLGADAQSDVFTDLEPNQTYSFRVRAYNDTAYSDYSDSANTSTLGTPSDLVAKALDSSSSVLNWTDNSTGETAFEIQRRTSTGVFAKIGTVSAGVTTFKSTGLGANAEYVYRVRAVNGVTGSEFSSESAIKTLGAPITLTVAAISASEVALKWVDRSTTELGFKIEQQLGTAAFKEVGTTGENVVTATVGGLLAAKAYSFRVRAYNDSGHSSYSNVATLTTVAPPASLVVVALDSGSAQLTWADKSANETGFKIERKTTGAFAQIGTVGVNVTKYVNTGLAANTTYVYRVRAAGPGGDSAYSNEATVTILAAPITLTVSAVDSGAALLNWVDKSSSEQGFKIERSTNGGAFAQVAAVAANIKTFTHKGHAANTTYAYRVRAYALNSNSSFSNAVSITTLGAPSPLSAAVLNGVDVSLIWLDMSTSETGFKVERRLNTGAFAQIAALAANAVAFTDKGLSANTSYGYRVRAYSASGHSSYSNIVTVKTLAPPAQMTALAISSSAVALTWTDHSEGETGFEIQRRLDIPNREHTEFETALRVGPNVTKATDRGLQPNKVYNYRVRAIQGNSASDWCPEWPHATTFSEGNPNLLLWHAKVNFGAVRVRKNEIRSFVMKNVGSGNLIVNTELIGPAPTGLPPTPTLPFAYVGAIEHDEEGAEVAHDGRGNEGVRTIKPGHSLVVKVRFTPKKAGRAEAVIIVTSNDPAHANLKVNLSGKGTE